MLTIVHKTVHNDGCGKMGKKKEIVRMETLAEKHRVTRAGLALLRVLADPEVRALKVIDQCRLAGITYDTYYRLFRDPRFQAAYRELCIALGLSYVARSIDGLASRAATGDAAAAKLILELAGMYAPTIRHEHTHEVGARTLREFLKAKKRNAIDAEYEAVEEDPGAES